MSKSKRITINVSLSSSHKLSSLFHVGLSRKNKESAVQFYPYGNGYLDDYGNFYPNDSDEWFDPYGNVHSFDEDGMLMGGRYWGDDDDVYPPHSAVHSGKGKSKRSERRGYWNQESREEGFTYKKRKHAKKGKRKCNIIQMYPHKEDLDFDSIALSKERKLDDFKSIWFYRDYHDPNDKEEFYTLKAFSDYCQEMGYHVSKKVADDIAYWSECHCCINPNLYTESMEIVAEKDYGNMFYEVCTKEEYDELVF